MKESLSKIENKIKNLIQLKRKLNPHLYWNGLLYIFFLVIVFLVIFSFYILYQVKNQQIFQITPKTTEAPSLINEKLLKKMEESFGNRLIKQKEINSGLNTYRDPSMN